MSKRSATLLVGDILASALKILAYTDGMTLEQFLLDEKTADAVIRNFEIIGEAAQRLPDEYKERHPEIDWIRIRGFRNRIVHDYMGVDLNLVWSIKQDYVPQLIQLLSTIQ